MDRMERSLSFNALADDVRQQIVEVLGVHGEVCQTSLVEAIGCAQPTVSKHITILRIAKVVTVRKAGTRRYYRLNDEVISDLPRYISNLQVNTPD